MLRETKAYLKWSVHPTENLRHLFQNYISTWNSTKSMFCMNLGPINLNNGFKLKKNFKRNSMMWELWPPSATWSLTPSLISSKRVCLLYIHLYCLNIEGPVQYSMRYWSLRRKPGSLLLRFQRNSLMQEPYCTNKV